MTGLDVLVMFFVASSAVSLYRVVAGPTVVDRMIGLNMTTAGVLAVLVLIAVNEKLPVYLDVALVYDIFGFIGLLAITRYFSDREGLT
jgi:multicomponent Na+:H+ antiporter subunit F